MENSKELKLDLDKYNHDYFLKAIFVLYDSATISEKIDLLNLFWTIRRDKDSAIKSEKYFKEFEHKISSHMGLSK